jgi:hypothetical protein
MKASWIFSIIKALEGRLEWCESDGSTDEVQTIREALEYFNSLDVGEKDG